MLNYLCDGRTLVDEFCGSPMDSNVYLHTIIIGIACIPTSFWLPLCVHRLGTKFFLGNIKKKFQFETIQHYTHVHQLIFYYYSFSLSNRCCVVFCRFWIFYEQKHIKTHLPHTQTVFSLLVAGVVTIGLYFVHNSVENLILSCIFEALTSLGISTVYCVMVDLFPTNLR